MIMQTDVLVVGGGVVGLSAAIAMAMRGHSVTILDAHPIQSSHRQLRVYAINQASQQLLQQLNIWPALDPALLSPYTRMHVWEASHGKHIDFDARLVQQDRLGTIVAESLLKEALLQQIKSLKITTCEQTHIHTINSSTQGVVLETEQGKWCTKLLMIADGAHSHARTLLNIPMTTWSYHQQAITAHVATELPHQHTAYQVFHAAGPLAFLPLQDPHHCSIVWSSRSSFSKHLMNLSPQAFETALQEAFDHHLGRVTLLSDRQSFPLSMRHTRQYSGPSWIMMGDAAHTVHPLAGLGLNIGLADLSSWLALLDIHGHWQSKKIMAAYQRQRLHSVWQSILMLQSIKYIFGNPISPVAWLRSIGLGACDQLPLLKRFFIEHANGLPNAHDQQLI